LEQVEVVEVDLKKMHLVLWVEQVVEQVEFLFVF
jgi:hypothetical protein